MSGPEARKHGGTVPTDFGTSVAIAASHGWPEHRWGSSAWKWPWMSGGIFIIRFRLFGQEESVFLPGSRHCKVCKLLGDTGTLEGALLD